MADGQNMTPPRRLVQVAATLWSGFLPSAIRAVVVGTDWMKPVGVTIGSHIAEFLHLGVSALAIARSSSSVWVLVFVAGHLCGHGGDGGGEFLDFRLHRQKCVLRLNVSGGVGG